MNKPNILLWDLETSYNMVLTFGIWEQNINPDCILVERHIHCVSYSWYGEKKVHSISQLDDPKRFKKDIHDDFYVVKKFREVMLQADAHVAHNGDKFDMPMLQSRIIFNGLRPLPNIKSIDTLKLAKKAKYNSRKLDYLAKEFGHKGKMDNPKGLWKECFLGDVKAMKHMAKYNRQDIEALRIVFEKLLPFANVQQLNANLFTEDMVCSNSICGSSNLGKRGFNLTRVGKFQRYQCNDCGAWSAGKKLARANPVVLK